MGFQNTLQINPAPATLGDFASVNPRSTAPAPEGGFVAGSTGVIVGRFAWIDSNDAAKKEIINSGSGKPLGFIANTREALITGFLAESGLTIQTGYPVTVYQKGDYYAVVTVEAATRGQKAFASLTTGAMQPGNAGATIVGFVETDYFITEDAAVGELTKISL